jgi:hypothetical protein
MARDTEEGRGDEGKELDRHDTGVAQEETVMNSRRLSRVNVVAYAYNTSTQEARPGGLRVQSQLELVS